MARWLIMLKLLLSRQGRRFVDVKNPVFIYVYI